jgi:hypothetical protein
MRARRLSVTVLARVSIAGTSGVGWLALAERPLEVQSADCGAHFTGRRTNPPRARRRRCAAGARNRKFCMLHVACAARGFGK